MYWKQISTKEISADRGQLNDKVCEEGFRQCHQEGMS